MCLCARTSLRDRPTTFYPSFNFPERAHVHKANRNNDKDMRNARVYTIKIDVCSASVSHSNASAHRPEHSLRRGALVFIYVFFSLRNVQTSH